MKKLKKADDDDLRLLKAARLVRHKKQGKQGFYALSADHVRCVLVDMLHHVNET